ncbi:hypothetical protein [Cytobacillus gottheilii]
MNIVYALEQQSEELFWRFKTKVRKKEVLEEIRMNIVKPDSAA